MISYQEALAMLLKQKQLSQTIIPIDNCAAYVAGEDILSSVFVPSFINSAVDGFAVRSQDLETASLDDPVSLKVMGRTMAGDACAEMDDAHGDVSAVLGAWEIMTGACVPSGYDAVVPVENVQILSSDLDERPKEVAFTAPVTRQANIRLAGEDYKPGEVIIPKGSKLNSVAIMALSAIGEKHIPVIPKPRVTLFSSGNEVVTDCSVDLQSGQIRDANGPYLFSALNESSLAITKFAGVLADNIKQFQTSILKAKDTTDVFISTGGVSAGRHDFIPDALRDLGAEILFHKVAIRPGKPILYGRLPNGSHYFGLPGNPISAAVGFRFFVLPLLRHLQGMPLEQPLKARLNHKAVKTHDFHFFAKSNLSITDEADLVVDLLEGQESFKTHPLIKSNCWAVFNENDYELGLGDLIDVYPLTPGCLNLSGNVE